MVSFKRRRIVSLFSGPKPESELLPFTSKVIKSTLVAVDKPTEDAIKRQGHTSWRTKDGQKIHLIHSSSLVFLEKIKRNSVDVFSILMPVGMPVFFTAKVRKFFSLLDEALRPNGRILFLSDHELLYNSIKNFFLEKGYTIIENDYIKKELMKRSQTISKLKELPNQGYLNESILFGFILWKKPKK